MSGRWFPLDDECGPVHGRFLMALRRHALDWPASIDPRHADETLGGLGVSGSPDACAAEASRWLLGKLRGAPA